MCQHCCRLEWTPCEPIPYACPLCPVRQLSDRCHGSIGGKRRLRYPSSHNKSLLKHNDLCNEISSLYSYVVSAKRNKMKRSKRRRKPTNEPDKCIYAAEFADPDEKKTQVEHPWTWKSGTPIPENVLPVQPRMAELGPSTSWNSA